MRNYGILENYKEFGVGIVEFALDDYVSTIKSLSRYYEKLDKILDGEVKVVKHHQRVGDICRSIFERIRNLNEIEHFFQSEWTKCLTTLDVNYLFEQTKRKLREKGYKVNLMGLVVSTDEKGVKVYANEKTSENGKFTTYCLGVNSKNQDGNWVNGYLNCKFKKGVTVANKSKIKIKSSFFVATRSNNKSYVHLMITDFELLEPGENAEDSADDFMKIPEGAADDAPFL